MMIELVVLASLVTLVLYVYNEFRAFYYIKPPTIHGKKTQFYDFLVANCKTLHKPFIPTFWAFNNHVQTWLKSISRFQECPELIYTRDYLEMNDNGIVSFDWVTIYEKRKPTNKKSVKINTHQDERPILLIIPSAMNLNVEDYKGLCVTAMKSDFKPLFFNRRGYSSTPLFTPKVNTYCDKSDLAETLEYLKKQFPFSEIFAIAFSMESGNLISYLGQEQEFSHISASVCVSSTFGCENLLNDHGLKEPYNYIITQKIKSIFHYGDGGAILDSITSSDEMQNCDNLFDLQEQIHARSNSYPTLKQYLQYNNPMSHLSRIRVPVLFIYSRDDPLIPEQSVPFQYFNMSETGILVTTEHGGHCGFYQDPALNSWADDLSVEFLSLILKKRNFPVRYNDDKKNGKINGSIRNRSMTIL